MKVLKTISFFPFFLVVVQLIGQHHYFGINLKGL